MSVLPAVNPAPTSTRARIPVDPNVAIPELMALEPGEAFIYFTGFLDSERGDPDVRIVAETAYKMYKKGKIHLTQRRLDKPHIHGMIDWTIGSGSGFQYVATGAA